MDRLTSIIVGIDFSPASATALAQAVRIAAWNQAKVQAVHVVDTLVVIELQEALSPLVKGIQDSLIADVRKRWAEFANDLPGKNQIDFAVAVNNQVVEFLARLHNPKSDLLVLGVKGGAHPASVGPIAAELVRRSPCKALLTREGHNGPYQRIVACVDFSETSRAAVDAAARIVAKEGGRLAIVHVDRPPWTRFHYLGPAAADDPKFQQDYRATLQRRLEAFCRPTSPESKEVKPTYHVLEATNQGAAIIEFTAQIGAELVVLGTRGRTNLREVLMGTTAERIIRGAPCSILAVKPVN